MAAIFAVILEVIRIGLNIASLVLSFYLPYKIAKEKDRSGAFALLGLLGVVGIFITMSLEDHTRVEPMPEWTCEKCRATNESDAVCCTSCGTLRAYAPMGGSGWACDTCHTSNSWKANFCKQCGTEKPALPPIDVSLYSSSSAKSNDPNDRWYDCPECGFRMTRDYIQIRRHCPKCNHLYEVPPQ